jgi:hypothetical protein
MLARRGNDRRLADLTQIRAHSHSGSCHLIATTEETQETQLSTTPLVVQQILKVRFGVRLDIGTSNRWRQQRRAQSRSPFELSGPGTQQSAVPPAVAHHERNYAMAAQTVLASVETSADKYHSRCDRYPWDSVFEDLNKYGAAVLPGLLSAHECKSMTRLFSDPALSHTPQLGWSWKRSDGFGRDWHAFLLRSFFEGPSTHTMVCTDWSVYIRCLIDTQVK